MPPTPPFIAITREPAWKHLEKSRRNYRFYLTIKGDPERTEWATTLLFYTALHLIQAYLWEAARNAFDVASGHAQRDFLYRSQVVSGGLRGLQIPPNTQHLGALPR